MSNPKEMNAELQKIMLHILAELLDLSLYRVIKVFFWSSLLHQEQQYFFSFF